MDELDFNYLSVVEKTFLNYKNAASDILKAKLILSTYDAASHTDVWNKTPLGTLINLAIIQGYVKIEEFTNLFNKYGNPTFNITNIFNMLGFSVFNNSVSYVLTPKFSLEEIKLIQKHLKEMTND